MQNILSVSAPLLVQRYRAHRDTAYIIVNNKNVQYGFIDYTTTFIQIVHIDHINIYYNSNTIHTNVPYMLILLYSLMYSIYTVHTPE